MNITRKLFLASIFALSTAALAQAQGDHYPPGQTTPQKVSSEEMQKLQQGDYYVARKESLSPHRIAALKACAGGAKFDPDSYAACMFKEGERP